MRRASFYSIDPKPPRAAIFHGHHYLQVYQKSTAPDTTKLAKENIFSIWGAFRAAGTTLPSRK